LREREGDIERGRERKREGERGGESKVVFLLLLKLKPLFPR